LAIIPTERAIDFSSWRMWGLKDVFHQPSLQDISQH